MTTIWLILIHLSFCQDVLCFPQDYSIASLWLRGHMRTVTRTRSRAFFELCATPFWVVSLHVLLLNKSRISPGQDSCLPMCSRPGSLFIDAHCWQMPSAEIQANFSNTKHRLWENCSMFGQTCISNADHCHSCNLDFFLPANA